MDTADIIRQLIDRVPLALVVIGVMVFVIGAAGGLPLGSPPLRITDSTRRVGLGIMGAVLAGAGLLLLTYGERSDDPGRTKVAKYGVKIINPRTQKQEGGKTIEVIGRYAVKPPKDALWLFILTPHDGRFWPKANIQDFDDQKMWRSNVWIAGGQ